MAGKWLIDILRSKLLNMISCVMLLGLNVGQDLHQFHENSKVLARQHGCSGLSEPSLVTYAICTKISRAGSYIFNQNHVEHFCPKYVF